MAAAEAGATGTQPSERIGWSVPEAVAVVVLIGLGLVAVGGVVGAVLRAPDLPPTVPSSVDWQHIGSVLGSAGAWGTPVFALFAMAVDAVAWWHGQAWADERWVAPEGSGADLVDRHVRRAVVLADWAVALLALIAVAGVAALVGQVLIDHTGSGWLLSADVAQSTFGLFGDLVLLGAGAWVAAQVRQLGQPAPAPGADSSTS